MSKLRKSFKLYRETTVEIMNNRSKTISGYSELLDGLEGLLNKKEHLFNSYSELVTTQRKLIDKLSDHGKSIFIFLILSLILNIWLIIYINF